MELNIYIYIYIYIFLGSLNEFLKQFMYPASSDIHMIHGQLYLLFNALHKERKIINEIFSAKFTWAPLIMVILSLCMDIRYMSIS